MKMEKANKNGENEINLEHSMWSYFSWDFILFECNDDQCLGKVKG